MITSTRSVIARAVTAAAERSDELYQLSSQLDMVSDPECSDLLGGLLAHCVATRFTIPLDLNAVAGFAAEFVAGFPEQDRPPQLYIEAAVRAGAGDVDLLLELPPEILVHLVVVTIAALIDAEAPQVYAAVEALLQPPWEQSDPAPGPEPWHG